MTPRPTRSIEPLPPPPGRFDQVLREARSRRYRRATAVTGVAGVFLAGIMGGLALGGIGGVHDRFVEFAGGKSTSQPPTTSATAATGVPSTSSSATHKQRPRHKTTAPGPTTQLVAMVRGRAVDSAGAPVADAYVYTGTYRHGEFVPKDLPAARTGTTGGFSIPCGPVLLTPWPLNQPIHDAAQAQVAAKMFAAPVCSRVAKAQVLAMPASGTLEGKVLTDVGCADHDFRLNVWIDGQQSTSVRLTHLREGDAFRVAGLPQGRHIVRIHGKQLEVTVAAAGDTVNRDITFLCPDLPTPTETPSLTPSPAPTPSETQSPSPSETPTATESSPSPTGSTSQH